MTITDRPSAASKRAEKAVSMSMKLLWWLPLSVLVGFVVANRLLSESWPLSQVVPLAVLLATPFGIGAYYGMRAVRWGEPKGWIPLVLHMVLMTVAVVMPISEALS